MMRDSLRSAIRRLPQPVRVRLRTIVHAPALRRRVRPVRWGNLRRLEPFSAHYGRDRGTPIDRVYIDAFFARSAADVRGRVLEVGSPTYTQRFGDGVTEVDVVDIAAGGTDTTIVADLADASSLPAETFDCVVVPQTLQYVRDVGVALRNCFDALAPGGVLLVTVPAIAKVDHHLADVDGWRFLPLGLQQLIDENCPAAQREVGSFGNLLAASASLYGVAAEELRAGDLDVDDSAFPVITWARVCK